MTLPTVKRVAGGAVPQVTVAPKAAAKIKQSGAALSASMQLPTEPCPVSTDIKDYSILLYARAGWGKTTLLATFPDAGDRPHHHELGPDAPWR